MAAAMTVYLGLLFLAATITKFCVTNKACNKGEGFENLTIKHAADMFFYILL
jgi:hypothetical protein